MVIKMAKKWRSKLQQHGEKKTKKTRKRDDKMVIKMATIWRKNGKKWR